MRERDADIARAEAAESHLAALREATMSSSPRCERWIVTNRHGAYALTDYFGIAWTVYGPLAASFGSRAAALDWISISFARSEIEAREIKPLNATEWRL